MKTLSELFDEKIIWRTPGRGPMAGVRKGRDMVLEHFGRLAQETGGTFRAELRHALADEDGRVVAIEHITGQRGARHLSLDCCLVFEFKQGIVVSGTEYIYDLHAADEFWA